jgi:hypothetical protein
MKVLPSAQRIGVQEMPLFSDGHEDVQLERWAANARISFHAESGAEVLVLSGSFDESAETFASQSWLRMPAGNTPDANTNAQGALVWVKLNHLAHVR